MSLNIRTICTASLVQPQNKAVGSAAVDTKSPAAVAVALCRHQAWLYSLCTEMCLLSAQIAFTEYHFTLAAMQQSLRVLVMR